jgi:peroxin-5
MMVNDTSSPEQNPYLHEGAPSSLLDSAKKLMASNGSLDEAALLIEASIQKGELGEGGYEAWLLLGRARSMDERETQALRALREGTRIAELNGAPGAGLLVSSLAHCPIHGPSSL